MKQTRVTTILTTVCLLGLMNASAETVEQVIRQARANLGPEKTLDAVKTLRYEGTVESNDGPEGKLTLVFKKPYKQFLEIETDAATEKTGVNGFEGWRELTNKEDPRRNGVLVLQPAQVQYLLSNALENLFFFDGPEQVSGGSVELAGSDTKNGVDCWVVDFIYPSGLRYTRYFDKSSGTLVTTVASNTSLEMVEKDTLMSGGIKFPKKVETYNDGKLVRTVTFEKIEVNIPVEDSLFDFPGIPTSGPRP